MFQFYNSAVVEWGQCAKRLVKLGNDALPRLTSVDSMTKLLFKPILEMNISLTPELESAVKQKVASGLYNNASEVIREALRITLKQEQENDWLKREAAIGFAHLDASGVTRVSSKDEFKSLVRGQNK